MRFLGIDPGLVATGYGCVELAVRSREMTSGSEPRLVEAGVINLNSRLPVETRLAELHADLSDVVRTLRPSTMVVERLYAHYAHPTTAIKMGHARGVILLVAAQCGLTLKELAATEVKKAITGNGHAGKRQMQLAIQAQCGLKQLPSPPDVADAIAIAMAAARRLLPEISSGRRVPEYALR